MKDIKIDVSDLCKENKLRVLQYLVAIGYKKHSDNWKPSHMDKLGYFIAYAPPQAIEWDYIENWDCSIHEKIESISFEKLRDLVVLKRNDVKDANYESATDFYYVTVENQYYFWNGFSWILSDADFISGLSPIIDNPENKDPALISGAEAELVEQAKKFITSDHLNRFEAAEAHLEGHPVQFMLANGDFIDITSDTTLGIFEKDGGYSFRLKPQIIKVELELPKWNKIHVAANNVTISFDNHDDAILASNKFSEAHDDWIEIR